MIKSSLRLPGNDELASSIHHASCMPQNLKTANTKMML